MSPVVHVLVCILFFFLSFSRAVFLFTGPRRVVHPQCGGQRYYLFHHPHNFDTWSSGGCLGDARVLVSALLLLFFSFFLSLARCSLVATTKHSHTTLRDTAGMFRSIDPKPTAEDYRILLYLLHI